MKITHITTAHPRFDTRIFYKMCACSVNSGHDVSLIVADGRGKAEIKGVTILDVGKPKSRLARFILSTFKAVWASRSLKSDIYHLHDPELLPMIPFINRDAQIIFDFHEDVRKQINRKNYIPKSVRFLISKFYGIIEAMLLPHLNGIICATSSIEKNYRNKRPTEVIRNFPLYGEFRDGEKISHRSRDYFSLVYVGGITYGRGIAQLVDALECIDFKVRLHLCGPIRPNDFQTFLKSKKGWDKVVYHGTVDRPEVVKILEGADVGLVTLLPDPSYEEALPVKMFEYFASRTAVIASNFPLWSSILCDKNLGIVVNPEDVSEIVSAINLLKTDDELRLSLVQNARQAFEQEYRWDIEHDRLTEFYNACVARKCQ